MWPLISEKDKRKYFIIESLYNAETYLTIQDLAKTTTSSIRSVQNYLNELKVYIEDLDGKITTSVDGIKLNMPSNIGLDYFQRLLFKETIGFTFVEKVFFDETLTNSMMEECLFVSSSTLNRLVTQVKESLASYGIQLESNPFRFSGEEWLIRKFFTQYFEEVTVFMNGHLKKSIERLLIKSSLLLSLSMN